MRLPGAILLLDNSEEVLAAFAKFSDSLQSSKQPIFIAIPANLQPERLPPLCRELPPSVLPLIRLSADIKTGKSSLLAAALGRPIAGGYLDELALSANLPESAMPCPMLVGVPPLLDDQCFRIANHLCVANDHFTDENHVFIDLSNLDPTVGAVEQVARLSAHLASPTQAICSLQAPCGGWLIRSTIHSLAEELTANLRTPQSCAISIAEAFSAVVRALANPDASEWLWHPLRGPSAHPQTSPLATTVGAIRGAAASLAPELGDAVPNTVVVDGYPVAAATFLQSAAEILRDNSEDNQIIRVPAVAKADFRRALAVLRQIPEAQRDECRNGLLSRSWETARI